MNLNCSKTKNNELQETTNKMMRMNVNNRNEAELTNELFVDVVTLNYVILFRVKSSGNNYVTVVSNQIITSQYCRVLRVDWSVVLSESSIRRE